MADNVVPLRSKRGGAPEGAFFPGQLTAKQRYWTARLWESGLSAEQLDIVHAMLLDFAKS
jgi:hypothetical protein